ncbi:Oxygen-independent coproporphyrinogen III oxidase [compost metagenome]
MERPDLLKKYNVAAPRYTSYPTVPYWENDAFQPDQWLEILKSEYAAYREEGISLYIHLPFCEKLCTYCGCNKRITKNHKVEAPYIAAVLKEWDLYVKLLGEKPKIRELHLGGGTPTFFSAENLHRLISSILGEHHEAECSFEGHPDNTTPAHLQTLYDLGFTRLSLGIQDFDPYVQFLINRFQTPSQVQQVTLAARQMGYHSVNYDLIYGLPGQTFDGLMQTMDEVLRMAPDRIAFYSYAHVPWLKAGQRHFSEADIPSGEAKFKLYEAGKARLLTAGYKEIGMDHFALPDDPLYEATLNGGLHRNFMGYTHQHTHILIGLGVSSISDSHRAFAQNEKTVEAYQQKLEGGAFAIEKGHLLTAQDQMIRQHILNLMCKNQTRFAGELPAAVNERLETLAEDHLIRIDSNAITITETGRSFLRNICMALDERLWTHKPESRLFSSAI